MWNYAWKKSEVGSKDFRLYRVTGSGFTNAEGRTDLDRAAPREVVEKQFGAINDEGIPVTAEVKGTFSKFKTKSIKPKEGPHIRKASSTGFDQN